ncbi:MAG: hypothetical protein J6L91_03050 [Clostridia bacterium]|nr:hypothetical protein [Clostridia bacterium]
MNKLLKDRNTVRYAVLAVALIFFAVRAVQMTMEISTFLAHPAATLYLLDFNFYLGSRTFIGSILTLLTEHITIGQIFAMNITVYVLSIVSYFAMGFYTFKKSVKENNDFLFLAAILFIVCPYGLLQFSNWVGTYDIYLNLFAVLCAFLTSKKGWHWLCPVICVAAIFTHYAFAFSFYPAVLAVQVYNIVTNDKKLSRILSAATGLIISFVSAVYCGFFANSTIKMTRDELYAYMAQRLGTEVENKSYIDSYYFQDDVFGMLGGFKDSIVNKEFITNLVLYFLPVMLAFFALWIHYITRKEKKQIFSGAFFIITLAVSIGLIFTIIEAPRWQTAAVLSQFLIFFTVIKKDDPTIAGCLAKLNKKPYIIAMAAFVVLSMAASFLIEPFYGP